MEVEEVKILYHQQTLVVQDRMSLLWMEEEEDEWMEVGAWVYENFDVASGVSFLPFSDHTYQQAPYQDIEPDEYLEWKDRMSRLQDFEKEDTTTGSRELACTAGVCEVVDLNAA